MLSVRTPVRFARRSVQSDRGQKQDCKGMDGDNAEQRSSDRIEPGVGQTKRTVL